MLFDKPSTCDAKVVSERCKLLKINKLQFSRIFSNVMPYLKHMMMDRKRFLKERETQIKF